MMMTVFALWSEHMYSFKWNISNLLTNTLEMATQINGLKIISIMATPSDPALATGYRIFTLFTFSWIFYGNKIWNKREFVINILLKYDLLVELVWLKQFWIDFFICSWKRIKKMAFRYHFSANVDRNPFSLFDYTYLKPLIFLNAFFLYHTLKMEKSECQSQTDRFCRIH